jgi:hypothetical protein
MLTGRYLKNSRCGSWNNWAVPGRNHCSSTRCIRTLAPPIEQEGPETLQFDFDISVGQSGYKVQSGEAWGSCANGMQRDWSCTVKADSITIGDASRAEAGINGHINNTANRFHSANCVIRLITPTL